MQLSWALRPLQTSFDTRAAARTFIDEDTAITRRRDRERAQRRGVDGRRRVGRIRRPDVSRRADRIVGAVRSAGAGDAGRISPQSQARVGLVCVAARARCEGRAQRRASRAGRARRPRCRFCAYHAKRRRPAPAGGQSQRGGAARQHRACQMLARAFDRRALDRGSRRGASLRLLRPDVVWFEETLPAGALQAAEDAARRCQILLVVGTSAEVYPAAALPDYAKAAGASIVEINPHPTPLSGDADYVLRAPAGVALPALIAASWPDA